MKFLRIAPFLCLLLSCKSYKNIPYFKDVPDSLQRVYKSPLTSFQEVVIQPDDILQVSIQTIDPQVNQQLAAGSGATFTTQSSNSAAAGVPGAAVIGYRVGQDGYIEIPLTGRLRVVGLTTEQTRDSVRNKASVYYKNPVVNVRFANFQVTILGEVARPATYVVPNERVDVLQALGMAGDLTIYGKRENVMVIREEGGQKTFTRLNLNSSEIFQSPYFQLQQRDIVYVEPSKSKAAGTDIAQTRLIALLGTVTSVLIVLFSRINFK